MSVVPPRLGSLWLKQKPVDDATGIDQLEASLTRYGTPAAD